MYVELTTVKFPLRSLRIILLIAAPSKDALDCHTNTHVKCHAQKQATKGSCNENKREGKCN